MLGRPTARLLKSAEESLPTPIRLSSATETSYYIEMPDEEAPAAPLYPSVPDEFACRICLESDQTPDDPLIAPCRCAGTTKWVRRGCLAPSIRARADEGKLRAALSSPHAVHAVDLEDDARGSFVWWDRRGRRRPVESGGPRAALSQWRRS